MTGGVFATGLFLSDGPPWSRRPSAINRLTATMSLWALMGCAGGGAPTVPPRPAPNPTVPPPPAPEPPEPARTWRGLTVAPEERCSPYDADDYRYPQSVEDDIARNLGGVYSPYTCEVFDSISETDIEHIVARSEAHDSGLCEADADTRTRFAQDLLNLTLAPPALNRSQKSDLDAAEWLPDQNRCWFAKTIVDVRLRYGLTIDQAEADSLEQILAGCQSAAISCDFTLESPRSCKHL